MAGRLPGVGLPQRKRSSEHKSHHRYALEAPIPSILHSVNPFELDETTLKARQRLQKKLGHFFPSSRESENTKKEGKVKSNNIQRREAGGIGRKILLSTSSLWVLRSKKERKVCAVCLEDLNIQEHEEKDDEVMSLSCSHKYHSQCLLPWLASHPHCPYCRTPVLQH